MIRIDGSQGEGGGQILRTSLALAALTGRACHLYNIRAGRSRPGLRPQHLAAVHATAAVCGAGLRGAALHSRELFFTPTHPPRGGSYSCDVADFAPGGSGGAVGLIFQAMLWPLLRADAPSRLTLIGGTHVPFSPPFHYLRHVFLPAVARLGVTATLQLDAWGWMSAGQGQLAATVEPAGGLQAATFTQPDVTRVEGVAGVTNLPAHIPQRMANRAHNLLRERGWTTRIEPIRARGAGPGAGIFLWVPQAGFSSLGRQGLPSETVAEHAVADLLAFVDNRRAVDPFLADQLLLPMALATGTSSLTTSRLTRHTLTQIELLRHWLAVRIDVSGQKDAPGELTIHGAGLL